ncbi:uncharacterized protein B0H18DRAFT_1126124 [Fomitopsis serialis]|uniref:uncharacterized protein n=1 Tax=Fomitopsis serialis TaxID=139415 RepID=UPI00200738FB|nr:uncharacterized protein B0H18DRAFT_1126124 [Neoantrodia serialis]KAH9913589.1 hypothetical protein B0H18DRAFT_1126124 [Neoantrodia serialis]
MLPIPTTQADWRLVNILGRNTDCYVEDAWRKSRECPLCPALNHVSVICLEKDHFGQIFDYCMLYDTEVCAMEASSEQASEEARATALEQALELENPPARFGGFLLMAAEEQLYCERTPQRPLIDPYPEDLVGQGRMVLVEALIYVHDTLPVLSIPLVGVLDWLQTKGTIPGPSQQPVLAQVFPYFNPYQSPRDPDVWTSFDQYKPTMQSFLPARIEDAFPIKFDPRRITAPQSSRSPASR